MATTHLDALNIRLSHEHGYLAQAQTKGERDLRSVWIEQIKKEIAAERAFLGMPEEAAEDEMSADDLMTELMA